LAIDQGTANQQRQPDRSAGAISLRSGAAFDEDDQCRIDEGPQTADPSVSAADGSKT